MFVVQVYYLEGVNVNARVASPVFAHKTIRLPGKRSDASTYMNDS